MTTALSIRQLTKTYGNGFQALKGIDLDVAEGDFFALLGPNGAGKSTTIGILSTLVNKTSGTVSVFGHDLDRDPAGLKRCLLYNSHGGQVSLLQPVALEMRRRGMLAAYASWFGGEPPPGLFEEDEWHFGYHGGGVETSMMLHLRPDLVIADKIRDYPTLARTVHGENEHLAADPGGARVAGFGWLSDDDRRQLEQPDSQGDGSRTRRQPDELARRSPAREQQIRAPGREIPQDREREQMSRVDVARPDDRSDE